jgi:hypothetical protein
MEHRRFEEFAAAASELHFPTYMTQLPDPVGAV